METSSRQNNDWRSVLRGPCEAFDSATGEAGIQSPALQTCFSRCPARKHYSGARGARNGSCSRPHGVETLQHIRIHRCPACSEKRELVCRVSSVRLETKKDQQDQSGHFLLLTAWTYSWTMPMVESSAVVLHAEFIKVSVTC